MSAMPPVPHILAQNRIFVNKSHFYQIDTLSRNYPESVVFLFSERDLKDSIVSHYFHINKIKQPNNLDF